MARRTADRRVLTERDVNVTGSDRVDAALTLRTDASVVFNTGRLELRPLCPADVDGLHALWTTPGVRRFLWDDDVISLAQTTEIAGTSERLFRERRFGLWGAWLPGDPDIVGFGGFWDFREPPELEILFGIRQSGWGHGYSTEIGGAVVDYGFGVLGFECIRASTDAGNVASIRVLEKLGFQFVSRAVVRGLDTRFFELKQRGDRKRVATETPRPG